MLRRITELCTAICTTICTILCSVSFLLFGTLLFGTLSANHWKVEGLYTHIPKAKFHKPDSQRDHHLNFTEEFALATYTHHYNDTNGFKFGIGYQGNSFHFSHHPRFSQRHFSNVLFQLGAYTKEIERWKWNLNLFSKTNTEHFHLSRYTFFTGELKGKYAWNKKRNLYAGILAFMGMRYSRALPIVGFDYKPSPQWKINAIFPIKMNVEYGINSHWSLETGLRFIFTRERLGKDDKLHRGFVAYRNWGLEGGVNYQYNEYIFLNAHVGESFAGRMRTSNHKDHHRKHLRLGMAPYFGFAAELHF